MILKPDKYNDCNEGSFDVQLSKAESRNELKLAIAYEKTDSYHCQVYAGCKDDEILEYVDFFDIDCAYYELKYLIKQKVEQYLREWEKYIFEILEKHKKNLVSMDIIGNVYSITDLGGKTTKCIMYENKTEILKETEDGYKVMEVIQGKHEKLSILQHLGIM